MKNPHEPDPAILEAIEACRPYSDDLADPAMAAAAAALAGNAELASLFQRIERLDVRIADAFEDVAVPGGLADRICRRLGDARVEDEREHDAAVETTAPGEPIAAVGEPGPRVSRRWLLVGSGGIVAAAAMFTAAMLQLRQPDYDKPAMLELAMQSFDGDWSEVGKGESIVDAAPPRDYALSPHVLQGGWVRWRPVSDFLGRRGVAYDLTRPGGPRATLYVVKYPLIGLPSRPSRTPALTTHDRSTSAWQGGPLLFVLVVEGGSHTYRSFLNLPTGPVA